MTTHCENKMKAKYQLPETFAEWQAFSIAVHNCATRIKSARDDIAWRLAASVGIPRDGCCLHNASIDESLTGWCAGVGGYERLQVAKRASHLLNDWRIVNLANRITQRAFDSVNRRAA